MKDQKTLILLHTKKNKLIFKMMYSFTLRSFRLNRNYDEIVKAKFLFKEPS